jgi:hypothetical protein
LRGEAGVKMRALFDGAVLEPATVAVVKAAFEQVWDSVKDRYNTQGDIERARLKLARAALALAARHSDDIEALKRAMLDRMTETDR